MRTIVVDASGMDLAARARARLDFACIADALRRRDTGDASMQLTGDDEQLITSDGCVLSLHRSCIPEGGDEESAALFLEAVIASVWRTDAISPSVQEEVAERIRPVADLLRALGHGVARRMALCLPTPTMGARAVTGTSENASVAAIMNHLLADCPAYVTVVRASEHYRMYPMGARIQQPGPVRDPVAAMRLLSTVPPELLP